MMADVFLPHLVLKITAVTIFPLKIEISRLHQPQGILLPITMAFVSKMCLFIILDKSFKIELNRYNQRVIRSKKPYCGLKSCDLTQD